MSRPRRATSSVSTFQIIGAVVVLLSVLVALAFFLAPDKPEAPPTSAISYQEPPARVADTGENTESFGEVPRATSPTADTMEVKEASQDPAQADAAETEAAFELYGRVENAKDGAPLNRVLVRAVPQQGDVQDLSGEPPQRRGGRRGRGAEGAEGDGQSPGRLATRTDKNGEYSLPLSSPGVYRVEFTLSPYIAQTISTAAFSESLPRQEMNTKLSRGSTVSGRVTETGGTTPAPEVRVVVQDRRDLSTVTDENGEYVLAGLSEGEAAITLDLRNTPYTAGKTLPFKKVKIAGPESDIKGVDFQVEPAGIVWGYVQTPNKNPVKDADVLLCTSDSPLAQALNAVARQAPPISNRSDGEGYYELRGVPLNQQWRLYATAESHSPQMADAFLLTPALRSVRIDIFMFAGTNVYGVVESTRGGVIPEAEVMCIPAYTKLLSPLDSPQAFRNTRSDENGAFSITELPPGEYQVFAQKKGFKVATQGTPIYPDGYNDLTNLRIRLNPVDEGSFAVFGVVVDGAGQGVDGAEVRLEGFSAGTMDSMTRTESTAGGGKFRFDGVGHGSYSLAVRKDGYTETTVRRVRLNEEIRVVLSQSALVRGVVLAKDTGSAPPIYEVAAYPLSADGGGRLDMMGMLGGGPRSTTFNNPDGSFELRLNAGEYRLEAKAADYAPARMEVALEAGQVMEGVTLTLNQDGGRIAGMVVAGDGGNVQGAEVILVEASSAAEAMMMAAAPAPDRTRQVGDDGAFSFENLPEGVFVVIARHPRYAASSSDVIDLPQGGRQENIRIRLGFGGSLEGYVLRDGQPSPGAVVVVVGGGGTTQNTTTDQQGYYHMDGLSTGVYQAMVTELSSGDLNSVYGARGLQVSIEEGQTTRCDFGSRAGSRIEGRCLPGPGNMLGGRVVLQMPGFIPGPLGGMADITQLMGQSTGISPLGQFVMEDVPQGEWQLNIYYFEMGGANPLQVRFVHTELITVGDQEVLPLVLQVSNY